MLWVGIDEAGYGPNLGPLVMSAVIVATLDDRPPDVWADLPHTVSRANGPEHALWIDDSKAVFKARKGRDRLDQACLAILQAAGEQPPANLGELLEAVGAGGLDQAELSLWIENPLDITIKINKQVKSFEPAPWRVLGVRSVVAGPARFNDGLARLGTKAALHFEAFSELLAHVWTLTEAAHPARVRSDKHGGRHFYWDSLVHAFPDVWVDRGVEGPESSAYVLRSGERRLELRLEPRADAGDGLVAMASLVSKSIRERWMDVFNAFWIRRIPDLKPTAGYPVDARRFREAIEPHTQRLGLDPAAWWRSK